MPAEIKLPHASKQIQQFALAGTLTVWNSHTNQKAYPGGSETDVCFVGWWEPLSRVCVITR